MTDDCAPPRRVLVIGGGGVFGSRLAAGLLATTEFAVIVAGRRPDRLADIAAQLAGALLSGDRGRVTCLVLDSATVTPEALASSGAFAVVDAAGPYQGADYRLARTAIAAGLHYIDLADARDFVAGFATLDAAAKAAGVVAMTGASSTPALSNAALDRLTERWTRVERVEIAIAPGNRAPRGLSVIRSILSYAGRPVRVFAGGAWRRAPGWGLLVRREMPGIGARWLSLAETPDLDIVPARFAVTDAVIFRAGLELSILHLGLWVTGLLVRIGVVRSLEPAARLVRGVAMVFGRFGADRGGMTVAATGRDADGKPVRGVWSLVAQAGDGPNVPTLPAIAALRALARGAVLPGASACVGILSLDRIEAEFAGLRIAAQWGLEPAPSGLYASVLGGAFCDLPAAVRRLHDPAWGLRARGLATVDGADSLPARLVARVFRFPKAGKDVAVTVEITPVAGGERWSRDFAGRRFASLLSASRTPGRIVERFGPLSFDLQLEVGAAGVLGMPVRAWRIGPLAMPAMVAPKITVTESVDAEDRFQFDVAMDLPFRLGRLVRYRGWLTETR